MSSPDDNWVDSSRCRRRLSSRPFAALIVVADGSFLVCEPRRVVD